MAEIQSVFSNYVVSEALLTKTLPYLKKTSKPIYARNVYSFIGYNYYNMYDYQNAILYHRKAFHLPGSSFKKTLILTDIILVYLAQKRYQEAAEILEILASKKITFKKDPQSSEKLYFEILNNLGFCYYNLKINGSLNLYNKSLKANLKLDNDFGLINNYKNLSNYYLISNPELAKEYAKKSYQRACKVNSATNKANSLAQLIKTTKGNDLKKYSLDYIKIIDSITKGRKQAKNQFSTIKYESKKDKEENFQLKAQKAENDLQLEKQKKRNIISYVIIFFSTVSSFALYFHLTSKVKKEKDKLIFESEMRISGKLHDELANDVYKTLAYAEKIDLSQEKNREQLLNILDTIYFRTRNISKENSPIITNENYNIALKEMISGYKTSDINIILNGFDLITWNKIEKNKKIILYRVLQELFSNMKKHSQATLVSINLKKDEKKLTVVYNDNGVGTNKKTTISKNGLQNVETRIKTINGNIIFDNNLEKGFRLTFSIPL
ncbi:ATP-binding protein [Flavobacterium psychroterrae]|uniref:histidine kinase n=1 Tax=Flavobacterium psychroterrae TaxID=2133767 RepID=A0ABS5PEQ6_9FLAO|nr:ATP-binding protein [Flavobacterium psychroterrae]MBS7232191.1 ATP-binding protein [Flavobacterium psychroterrae]